MGASLEWRTQWGTYRVTKFWQGGRGPVTLTVWLLFLETLYLLHRPCVIWENRAAARLVCFLGHLGHEAPTGEELRDFSRPLHTGIVTTTAGLPTMQVSDSSLRVLLRWFKMWDQNPSSGSCSTRAFLGVSQRHQNHLERDGGKISPFGPWEHIFRTLMRKSGWEGEWIERVSDTVACLGLARPHSSALTMDRGCCSEIAPKMLQCTRSY